MKNIFKYFGAAIVGCVAFTSCDNNAFLDVTHYSLLGEDAMFASDVNAVKGMNGCYDLLHRRAGMIHISTGYSMVCILRWTRRLPVGTRTS